MIVLNLLGVALLNANLVVLYEQVSSDQAAQQAIVGKAAAVSAEPVAKNGSDQQQEDLGAAYSHSRDQLEKAIES